MSTLEKQVFSKDLKTKFTVGYCQLQNRIRGKFEKKLAFSDLTRESRIKTSAVQFKGVEEGV